MKSVFGLANNPEQLNKALDALVKIGCLRSDISVLWPDTKASKDQFNWETDTHHENNVGYSNTRHENNVGHSNSKTNVEHMDDKPHHDEKTNAKKEKKHGGLSTEAHTKAPEGGVTGATAGGIFGGTLGLLAGLGSLAIPGLGPFIAAGPIMAALSGSAIGGGLGLLLGTLIGYGIPEYEAKRYGEGLKAGKILISVLAKNESEIPKIKETLQHHGITDISYSEEKTGSRK